MQTTIPFWLVAALGSLVALKEEYRGACETYAAGCVGVLEGIHASDDRTSLYVTVALDPEDDTYVENFPLDAIVPVLGAVSFSLDLERGQLQVLASVGSDNM